MERHPRPLVRHHRAFPWLCSFSEACMIAAYRGQMLQRRQQEAAVARARAQLAEQTRLFERSEEHLLALQSVGQMIGEVLTQLDEDRYIVKASQGPRYVVGCRGKVRLLVGDGRGKAGGGGGASVGGAGERGGRA